MKSNVREPTELKVFWVVMLCSVVVGYRCFGGACSSELLVSYYDTMWPQNPQDLILCHHSHESLKILFMCSLVNLLSTNKEPDS